MVQRAAELARDSHARTRHAVVLTNDDASSLLAWGTNGVPFPGEDHCYCKFGELGRHDLALGCCRSPRGACQDGRMSSPRAGQPAAAEDLVDVAKLVTAYYALHPDPAQAAQQVSFGTSGHRGSALQATFNEDHIVAT